MPRQRPTAAAATATEAEAEPAAEPTATPKDWASAWIGRSLEEVSEAYGRPVLSIAGEGGPDDRMQTYRLPEGRRARFVIRSGVVVQADRY